MADNSTQSESAGCSRPGCLDENAHTHLLRFTFRLPDALGLADGFSTLQIYANEEDESNGTFADVTIRQVKLKSDDPTTLSWRSIFALGHASPNSPTPPSSEYVHSVARVITPANSPRGPSPDWNNKVQNLLPQEDAFMRALHAVQTIVRGVNLLDNGYSARLPTYERMPFMILLEEKLVETPILLDALSELVWEKQSTMLLHHSNAPGMVPGEVSAENAAAYGREIAIGNPAVLAKERFIDARNLIHREGDYAAAVVTAATGLEVLADSILSALLWEMSLKLNIADTELALQDAAKIFSDSDTALKRAKTHTTHLLKGSWTLHSSPWEIYRSNAASIRNRIVHAGYQVSRLEAEKALQETLNAQTFLFDRLADQRRAYPRVCYLFLGSPGLIKRDLFKGTYKSLVEKLLASEPDWSSQFSFWHKSVIESAN